MALQIADVSVNDPVAGQDPMTAQEYEVLRHVTAAWTAFLQLPTERIEYVLAFQSGCQELQRQLTARQGNRIAGQIPIPSIVPLAKAIKAASAAPVDKRTPLQKLLDRKAKNNALHKRRRAEKQAADPEGFREKERQKWQQRKARQDALLAAAGHVKRQTAPAAPRAKGSAPTRTDGIEAPSGLSQADRVRWRYNNDPVYREHVKSRNSAYQQKRRSEGHKYPRNPKTDEARARDRERKRMRLAIDPAYAERRRAQRRDWAKRYRQSLKNLSQSKIPGAEVRMRHLRMDPIYSAAHAAIPAGLPAHHRADIVSDIIMAVLEGQMTLDEVPKKARSFVTAHHRRSETYSTVSLDASIGDGEATMHDFLTEAIWS